MLSSHDNLKSTSVLTAALHTAYPMNSKTDEDNDYKDFIDHVRTKVVSRLLEFNIDKWFET